MANIEHCQAPLATTLVAGRYCAEVVRSVTSAPDALCPTWFAFVEIKDNNAARKAGQWTSHLLPCDRWPPTAGGSVRNEYSLIAQTNVRASQTNVPASDAPPVGGEAGDLRLDSKISEGKDVVWLLGAVISRLERTNLTSWWPMVGDCTMHCLSMDEHRRMVWVSDVSVECPELPADMPPLEWCGKDDPGSIVFIQDGTQIVESAWSTWEDATCAWNRPPDPYYMHEAAREQHQGVRGGFAGGVARGGDAEHDAVRASVTTDTMDDGIGRPAAADDVQASTREADGTREPNNPMETAGGRQTCTDNEGGEGMGEGACPARGGLRWWGWFGLQRLALLSAKLCVFLPPVAAGIPR